MNQARMTPIAARNLRRKTPLLLHPMPLQPIPMSPNCNPNSKLGEMTPGLISELKMTTNQNHRTSKRMGTNPTLAITAPLGLEDCPN